MTGDFDSYQVAKLLPIVYFPLYSSCFMTEGSFSSLRCFERFFRGVNVKEGKLVAKRRAYLMEDLNLIGVDYLWQVTTVVSTTTIFIILYSISCSIIN